MEVDGPGAVAEGPLELGADEVVGEKARRSTRVSSASTYLRRAPSSRGRSMDTFVEVKRSLSTSRRSAAASRSKLKST
jgi:hypothetical protein